MLAIFTLPTAAGTDPPKVKQMDGEKLLEAQRQSKLALKEIQNHALDYNDEPAKHLADAMFRVVQFESQANGLLNGAADKERLKDKLTQFWNAWDEAWGIGETFPGTPGVAVRRGLRLIGESYEPSRPGPDSNFYADAETLLSTLTVDGTAVESKPVALPSPESTAVETEPQSAVIVTTVDEVGGRAFSDHAQKLLAELCRHHEYDSGGVGKTDHIGVQEAARRLNNTNPGVISRAFVELFPDRHGKKGHSRYVQICQTSETAIFTVLRDLTGEFASRFSISGPQSMD